MVNLEESWKFSYLFYGAFERVASSSGHTLGAKFLVSWNKYYLLTKFLSIFIGYKVI